MRFGYFDDSAREYVITTPKTPYPWINYLGTRELLRPGLAHGRAATASTATRACGASRATATTTSRTSRAGATSTSRRTATTGRRPMRRSRRELDSFECRHGLGYTRITGARARASRPKSCTSCRSGTTRRCTRSRCATRRTERARCKLFSFVEFCLWNAHDDMTNYQRNLSTGEVEVDGSTIYHKTEYRERRNHFAFYHVNAPGRRVRHRSRVVRRPVQRLGRARGRSRRASRATRSPAAGRRSRRTASTSRSRPGEEKTFVFVLGYVENPDEEKWEKPGVINKTQRQALIAAFSTPEQVAASAGDACASTGRAALRATRSSSPRREAQSHGQHLESVPVHGDVQHVAQRLVLRDGHRPRHGLPRLEPGPARLRAPGARSARASASSTSPSTQFPDGSAYHQYQPLTKRGNNDVGSGFNDDPLWLILGVAAYIKETGDYGILDEQRAVRQRPEEHRRRCSSTCKRSFDHVLEQPGAARPAADRPRRLERLPQPELLHRDARTSPSRPPATATGRTAESCSSPACSCTSGRSTPTCCERRGEPTRRSTRPRRGRQDGADVVLKHGWDGDWFLRAYDFFGNKVGSKENEEGQIFIEPQGFCVMAGIGVERRPGAEGARLREGAARHAVRHRAQQPALHRVPRRARRDLARIPPGYKENAGIFCHNNPWIMIAETVVGRGGARVRVLQEDRAGLPRGDQRGAPHGAVRLRADDRRQGRGTPRRGQELVADRHGGVELRGASRSTCSACARSYDGLIVQPCLPKEVHEFTVRRKCRGAEYEIHVKNSGKGGAPQADGRRQSRRRQPRPLRQTGQHRQSRVRRVIDPGVPQSTPDTAL